MRPQKTTVDYFPHRTTSGRTIFILENLYGNDGYAAWFKILEILGLTSGHAYDYSTSANFQYLCAKLGVSGEKTLDILKTLAELEAIDPDLHSQCIVWSDNFCTGLDSVYQKRNTKRPEKPCLRGENDCASVVSGEKTPQRKEKETIEENKLPCANQPEFAQPEEKRPESKFSLFWKAYPKKRSKGEAVKAWKQVKGDSIAETIISSVERFKQSDPQWKKENGKFIPHPATWLRASGWEDEPELYGATTQTIRCPQCQNRNIKQCRDKDETAKVACGHFVEGDAI